MTTILFYHIILEGCQGITDEFATITIHLSCFQLEKSIPVHSLILPSHLFFSLPLSLFHFTLPCGVFAKPEDPEMMWAKHLIYSFLTRIRSSSFSPVAAWIFLQTSTLVTWSFMKCSKAFSSILCQ